VHQVLLFVARQRRTTICREGWYYLLVLTLVLGGAMLRELNLLLVVAGLLLGPLLFNWRSVVHALRGLEVQRKVPQGVCAGDLLVANVSLHNKRRRIGSWAVVVEDQVQRESDGVCEPPLRPSVLFPYVAAGGSSRGVYRGRLVRRGRYRLGPLKVSSRFPFGLFCRTILVGKTDTLTVFPRLGRLAEGWVARQHEAFEGTHRRERRHGPDGDFYGLRPWRSGDSRRWIHWRSSARVGTLVVRQFEQPRTRDAAVLLDLWQPEQPAAADLENVEMAVSFAATVVTDLCRTGGGTLLFGAPGRPPELASGPASLVLLQDVMRRLAALEARSADDLPELLDHALREIAPGSDIILVSTRAVDLGDTVRFAALHADPARRALARRIRCVDASSDELAQYFQPE
jgi:uncharacterized protein (DUF58 family)